MARDAKSHPPGRPGRPTAKHAISSTGYYDDVVERRMAERGVTRSEALRQFIDEAQQRTTYRSEALRTHADWIHDRAAAVAQRRQELVQDMAEIMSAAKKIRTLS